MLNHVGWPVEWWSNMKRPFYISAGIWNFIHAHECIFFSFCVLNFIHTLDISKSGHIHSNIQVLLTLTCVGLQGLCQEQASICTVRKVNNSHSQQNIQKYCPVGFKFIMVDVIFKDQQNCFWMKSIIIIVDLKEKHQFVFLIHWTGTFSEIFTNYFQKIK